MIKASKFKKVKDLQSKKTCQMHHAKKRAKTRIGIELTDELNSHIISCIKNGKPSELFTLKWLLDQSNRIAVYELTFVDKNPINVVYDKHRKQIVTFLFPEELLNIYYYYDIFQNKISTKHSFGLIWYYKDNKLTIPGETVTFENEHWKVIAGTLEGRKFKFEEDDLVEII